MKLITKLMNLLKPLPESTDGYHNFKELYQHRDALFLNLCIANIDKSWWSRRHSDGTEAFGYPYVIVGIETEPGKQITYHINTKDFKFWGNFSSRIKELDFAPLWDHHTSDDVIHRLKTLQILSEKKKL